MDGGPVSSSEISGFYKKGAEERWKIVREFGTLSEDEVRTIGNTGALKFDQVDRMIENAVGTMSIPLGVAVNFRVKL